MERKQETPEAAEFISDFQKLIYQVTILFFIYFFFIFKSYALHVLNLVLQRLFELYSACKVKTSHLMLTSL